MKGKKNKGLNLIDALIIMALILGVAGMLVRFYMTHRSSADTTASVRFVIAQADPALLSAFEAGGTLCFADGEVLGEIEKDGLTSAPATLYPSDAHGRIGEAPSALFREIRGEIRVDGRFTEGGFVAARGKPLAPGQTLTVSSRYLEAEILLLSIEKI